MDPSRQHPQYQPSHQQSYQQSESSPVHQLVKAATALTAGGSFLMLSGLLLVGTVIALTVATPLLVIFSPVLVPALATVVILIGGFVTSGGFGIAALSLLSWMYKYVKGEHPPGAEQIDEARRKIASKARDVKEYGQQQIGGAQAS